MMAMNKKKSGRQNCHKKLPFFGDRAKSLHAGKVLLPSHSSNRKNCAPAKIISPSSRAFVLLSSGNIWNVSSPVLSDTRGSSSNTHFRALCKTFQGPVQNILGPCAKHFRAMCKYLQGPVQNSQILPLPLLRKVFCFEETFSLHQGTHYEMWC